MQHYIADKILPSMEIARRRAIGVVKQAVLIVGGEVVRHEAGGEHGLYAGIQDAVQTIIDYLIIGLFYSLFFWRLEVNRAALPDSRIRTEYPDRPDVFHAEFFVCNSQLLMHIPPDEPPEIIDISDVAPGVPEFLRIAAPVRYN